ncbi:MAG: NAD-dependent epimerase/dehydratase family protein [Polaribacter sp.]|nr:NAD-dependent epimerase/dehydratase family protein [Polaribacter sp.]
MNILITGSSGTIGTRLCEVLKGHNIIPVDQVENKFIDIDTNICDLRDMEQVNTLPTDVDMIIHLAANAKVHDSVVEPAIAYDNVTTTFNMLEFARLNGCKKFIFASSREVYGNVQQELYKEDMVSIDTCESPYTASKMAGEALVQSYSRCYDIDHIIIRFSNVYGMYDISNRVVPTFFRQALKSEDIHVYGDKVLDFTYIDDAIHGILQCIKKFDTACNNVFNIAYSGGTSIQDVADIIINKLGSLSSYKTIDIRVGEISRYIADITKAKRLLDYRPKFYFSHGMYLAIDWYEHYFLTHPQHV